MFSAKNTLLLALFAGWIIGLASQFHSGRALAAYLLLSALMVAFAVLRSPRRRPKTVPAKPARRSDDRL
jgi:hypothetical protein